MINVGSDVKKIKPSVDISILRRRGEPVGEVCVMGGEGGDQI